MGNEIERDAPHSTATRLAKKKERNSCRLLGQTNGKRRVRLFTIRRSSREAGFA
jgi:hypothetical protein